MKIASYPVEEIFNKTFLWRYSKNQSYIRQLLYVFYEMEPDKAETFWKSFKKEIIDRVAQQIEAEMEKQSIVNFSERGKCLASNWEYIIDEFLMSFSPYYALVVIFSQSIGDLFDNVASWFFNKIRRLSIQSFSEIKEIQFMEYHAYSKHIREICNELLNVSVDLSNYIMIQPYKSYADALHITSTVSQYLSLSEFERLVRNFNVENRILRKIDLKMINACIKDRYTRNIMLTVVFRYAMISKITGEKPTTLNVRNVETKVTYYDIICEMKAILNEEEMKYLLESINKIKAVGIKIEDLI